MNSIDIRGYHIIIKRKPQNKNSYLRLKPDGTVELTCPYNTDLDDLMTFIERFLDRLDKKVDREKMSRLEYKDQGNFYYLDYRYQINVIISKKEYVKFDEGYLNVYVKSNTSEQIKKVIDRFMKKQAQRLFEERSSHILNYFSEIDFVPEIKVAKMHSRFGVCYYKKNLIKLSTMLLHYDVECIDYVIVHELCHFIQPNHSKKFYYLVEKYLPSYKNAEKKLKNIK
jgi:predicted metal-dependent hydrolase